MQSLRREAPGGRCRTGTVISIVAVLIQLLATSAHGASAVWRARDIANYTTGNLTLRKGKGEFVAAVSPARIRVILGVKERIEQQAGISAELVVLEGNDPNAFATPSSEYGPLVAINLGMLDLIGDDMDGYAAILGHEYAHLTLKHRDSRQTREVLQGAASVVLGVLLGRAGFQFAGTISDMAASAVATTFTRDEERAADGVGLTYAIAAGYDPQGGVRLWEKMAARGQFSIPFLSTHPASSERVEMMRQQTSAHIHSTRIANLSKPSISPTSGEHVLSMSMSQPKPAISATDSRSPYASVIGGVRFELFDGGVTVMEVGESAQSDLIAGDYIEGCTHISYPRVHILADLEMCKGRYAIRRNGQLRDAYVQSQATPTGNEVLGISTSVAGMEKPTASHSRGLHAAQRAAVDNPGDPNSWRDLGLSYENLGESGNAIRAYERALELQPRSPTILERLGGLYAKNGDKDRMRDIWEELTRLDPQRAEKFFASHFMSK